MHFAVRCAATLRREFKSPPRHHSFPVCLCCCVALSGSWRTSSVCWTGPSRASAAPLRCRGDARRLWRHAGSSLPHTTIYIRFSKKIEASSGRFKGWECPERLRGAWRSCEPRTQVSSRPRTLRALRSLLHGLQRGICRPGHALGHENVVVVIASHDIARDVLGCERGCHGGGQADTFQI